MISCQTSPTNNNVEPVKIPLPKEPKKPGIQFSDNGEYLILSYKDGKKLAIYFTEIEAYQEKLLSIIEYEQAIDKKH